jgi:hypothetical protein
MSQLANAWPGVLIPLRGYSVAMASRIPNGTLDLVFIDAAHDYRNARADILAYWPKLKSTGVMAGHDFSHWYVLLACMCQLGLPVPKLQTSDTHSRHQNTSVTSALCRKL